MIRRYGGSHPSLQPGSRLFGEGYECVLLVSPTALNTQVAFCLHSTVEQTAVEQTSAGGQPPAGL